jgi:hypothetical protein
MTASKNLFWSAFALFVAAALYFDHHIALFSGGPMPAGKALVWLAFVAFTAYTIHCSRHENLFRSIGLIAQLHWGRQIGSDLYLGLSIFLFLIYLDQGSIGVVLLWLLPVLAFANLATLLYLALHFDSIVVRFAS